MRRVTASRQPVLRVATWLTAVAIASWPAAALSTAPSGVVSHDLYARIEPGEHRLEVRDRLHVPASLVTPDLTILLNSRLSIRATTSGPSLELVSREVLATDVGMDREDGDRASGVRVNVYRVAGAVPAQDLDLELTYQGRVDYPVRELGQQYSRGFSESPGLIDERGVYLAGSTYWTAQVPGALVTYQLETSLPATWRSVSQGSRIRSSAGAADPQRAGRASDLWRVDTPTEEVHLIAARYTEYERKAGAARAYAFLRRPDDALAARYLDATAQYLEMYRNMLGPYPYAKFALVENFWETGYGMPSFTLLGEEIIRFPFILHSSYPHELLHNWWGNGVFVDFSGGNWCEGLTAYLADHLVAEQRGQGAEHRRDILQRVSDYVTPRNDFPLTQFRSRTDAVTEAIGYGKTAMIWNMLREKIGDAAFLGSLQAFYRDYRFRTARFDDIRRSAEAVTGLDLEPFFSQWVTRKGVPELRLDGARRTGNRVAVTLSQVQAGQRFDIDVPVAIHTSRGVEIRKVALGSAEPTVTAAFDLQAPATRVEIDPQFQLYRRLSPFETPPSLSQAFGSEKVLIVVPSGASGSRYAGLLRAWARAGVEVVDDDALAALPDDRAVWVLGAGNRHASRVADAIKVYDATIDTAGLHLGGAHHQFAARSVVVATRNPRNPAGVLVLLSAATAAAADGLARKLPHYGKYSWLVFTGDAPDNAAKGEWPTRGSPLVRDLGRSPVVGKLPVRKALAEVPPVFDAHRMQSDVAWLSAPERQGRGVGTRGLDDAADYIAEAFRRAGLEPARDGADYFADVVVNGEDGKPTRTRNVIGLLPGSNPAYAGQSLVLSAHYDHLGYGWPDAREGQRGRLHPGADDNASGVAVLLELARVLSAARPERTLVFAAFTAEESGLAGARAFVAAAQTAGAAQPASGIIADLNLDTVGRLQGGPLTIFGADSAREWPHIVRGATAVTGVPTTVVSKPVDASDHTAFVEAGIPAVQFFASTAVDYHRPTDTADKIDVGGLVEVARVVKEAADYLAGRPDPLHYTGRLATVAPADARGTAHADSAPARRAATGIVPDMAYEGAGVRVAGVAAGSGAERAGLQVGDILASLGGRPTPDLRALADVLQTLRPGDAVDVQFRRDEVARTTSLTLGVR